MPFHSTPIMAMAMFTCGQWRADGIRYAGRDGSAGTGQLRYSMFITYHRVGRIHVLPALAAVAAAVMVAGVAATALVAVGVAAVGVRLFRAVARIGRAEHPVPSQDDEIIEGVVVDSTHVVLQPPSRRSLQPLGNLDQQAHEQYRGGAHDEDRQRAQ